MILSFLFFNKSMDSTSDNKDTVGSRSRHIKHFQLSHLVHRQEMLQREIQNHQIADQSPSPAFVRIQRVLHNEY